MATFTDNKSREWNITLDALLIYKIREECDPKFLSGDFSDTETSTFDRLRNDPALLCRVLYILCESQRTERGIDERDFYLHVIGDAIDRATEAMLLAIANFSPRRTREVMEVFAKQDEMRQKALTKVTEKFSNPELAAQVEAEMERQIEESFSLLTTRLTSVANSPDSSESTHAA